MLSVTCNPFMVSVVMLIVVILGVVVPQTKNLKNVKAKT
jgi:hypothetical protein